MSFEFSWVLDNETLSSACDHWSTQAFVCVDTEFVRRTTFFPQLGLIQISDGVSNWLIDPVNISEWTPFVRLMSNRDVLKVMHSASEDVDVMNSRFDVVPAPLFDTQVAAAIAGVGAGLGFAKLVDHFTGVLPDKGETTSDWMKRPLTARQCDYAVADVEYLAPCYIALKALLEEQGRIDWVLEDSQRMIDNHPCFLPHEDMYTRVKGTGRLRANRMAICQSLAEWREGVAKQLDRPRSRVLKDADLLAICMRAPEDTHSFPRSEYLTSRWLKRFGEEALAAVRTGVAVDEALWPLPPKEPDAAAKSCFQAMKQVLEQVSLAQGIPEAALASKKDLFALIHSLRKDGELTPLLGGWRGPLLAEPLKACMPK